MKGYEDNAALLGRVATAFVFGGFAGWLIENILDKTPRYSKFFAGAPIPFLPVYGVGAAAVVATAPHLAHLPIVARGGVYAAGLSALEWAGCHIDRSLSPRESWNYGRGACVDIPHAVMWGALGLGVEACSSATSSLAHRTAR